VAQVRHFSPIQVVLIGVTVVLDLVMKTWNRRNLGRLVWDGPMIP
jgi:hypothetical protein